jgi:hypothetical protein
MIDFFQRLPNASSGTSRALLAEALNGLPALSHKLSIRAGIFWMLVTTGLFVCQDSTARILLQAYPATEIAFARYFVHMILVSLFIAWRNPRLAISCRPMLQMLRSGFLLAATLFGMLALKIMPLVDFSAIVWGAPVLVTALSGIVLHEKVKPGASVLRIDWRCETFLSRSSLHRSASYIVAPFSYTALLWATLSSLFGFFRSSWPTNHIWGGIDRRCRPVHFPSWRNHLRGWRFCRVSRIMWERNSH